MTVRFWELTSGSYLGMESSQWGSEEQVVPVAFSIGQGVIKRVSLIHVAYMQPALLIQQQLKMILLLVRRAYSFTYPYTNR